MLIDTHLGPLHSITGMSSIISWWHSTQYILLINTSFLYKTRLCWNAAKLHTSVLCKHSKTLCQRWLEVSWNLTKTFFSSVDARSHSICSMCRLQVRALVRSIPWGDCCAFISAGYRIRSFNFIFFLLQENISIRRCWQICRVALAEEAGKHEYLSLPEHFRDDSKECDF